jgi:hypothetical protein
MEKYGFIFEQADKGSSRPAFNRRRLRECRVDQQNPSRLHSQRKELPRHISLLSIVRNDISWIIPTPA